MPGHLQLATCYIPGKPELFVDFVFVFLSPISHRVWVNTNPVSNSGRAVKIDFSSLHHNLADIEHGASITANKLPTAHKRTKIL